VQVKRRATPVSSVALILLSTFYLYAPVAAQKNKPTTPAAPLLTRTTTLHDTRRLGYSGAVTLVGAPAGSITIEGWQRSEVEVNAEVELRGPTAADLDRLALVNGYAIDEDANHIRIITTGTHDKKYLKRVAKDFPKSLIGLPWKVDYHIKVPGNDRRVDRCRNRSDQSVGLRRDGSDQRGRECRESVADRERSFGNHSKRRRELYDSGTLVAWSAGRNKTWLVANSPWT